MNTPGEIPQETKISQVGTAKEEKLWARLKSLGNAPWALLGISTVPLLRLVESLHSSLSRFDFILHLSYAGAVTLLLVIFRHQRKKILLEIVQGKAPELYPKLKDSL